MQALIINNIVNTLNILVVMVRISKWGEIDDIPVCKLYSILGGDKCYRNNKTG